MLQFCLHIRVYTYAFRTRSDVSQSSLVQGKKPFRRLRGVISNCILEFEFVTEILMDRRKRSLSRRD